MGVVRSALGRVGYIAPTRMNKEYPARIPVEAPKKPTRSAPSWTSRRGVSAPSKNRQEIAMGIMKTRSLQGSAPGIQGGR